MAMRGMDLISAAKFIAPVGLHPIVRLLRRYRSAVSEVMDGPVR
jgi:hypothetical protein